MTIYFPIYDNGRKIESVNSEDLRIFCKNSVCRWKNNAGFYGSIYNADSAFTSYESAVKYWNREPIKRNEYFTDFTEVVK